MLQKGVGVNLHWNLVTTPNIKQKSKKKVGTPSEWKVDLL